MITFKDLIIIGKLGNISLGDSMLDIVNLLGQPDGVSTFKKPLIYKYSILEITFDFNHDSTNKICIGFEVMFWQMKKDNNLSFPPHLIPKDWFPNHNTRPDELEEYFNKNEIPWKINPYPWSIDEDNLVYQAGLAIFAFQNGLEKMSIDTAFIQDR
jgi:hypothetical protein